MEPDMLELRRLPERRDIPVQIPHPAMDSRIAGPYIPEVTLEMLHVHRIKADDRREEPDIRFCDRRAEIERLACFLRVREVRFDLVQGREERRDGLLVGLLRGCEAGLVHAVVDVVVGPLVCRFDLGAQRRGEEVYGFVGVGEEVVKFVVEHADDFRALYAAWLVLLLAAGKDDEPRC